jgi:hypothetical protein
LELLCRIARHIPKENKREKVKISHCRTSNAVPRVIWTTTDVSDEAAKTRLERVKVVAYATVNGIIDESQRNPCIAFSSRALRLGRRTELSELIGSPCALDVILSIKNDTIPEMKSTPAVARNTGNPTCWRVSPY